MKTYLKILAILVSIVIMQPSHAASTPENPVYYLEYSVSGTGVEIRLNDIPVLSKDAMGTTESVKPIPESIINGKNVLTIRTFPLEDYDNKYKQNASVDAKLTVNGRNAPLNASTLVLQLHVQPATDIEHVLSGNTDKQGCSKPQLLEYSDKEIVAERSVHIDSPYPRWAWQDGVVIEDNKANYDSLLAKYKEVYHALKDKDMKLIHETHQAAALEYAHAYDYNDVQHGYRIMNAGGYIDQHDWELGDINLAIDNLQYHLSIFANGKLAKLVAGDDDPTLITYLNPEEGMVSLQDFTFYKNKAGEWILIR